MYQEQDPESFLIERGWKYKPSGENFETDCPLCGKERHFYIHKFKGVWHCKVCDERGNIYQLKAKLGLQEIRPVSYVASASKPETKKEFKKPIDQERIREGQKRLQADAEVMEYLRKERAFSDKVIKAMSLTLENAHGVRWVGFPWRRAGKFVGMKKRIFPKDVVLEPRGAGGKMKPKLPKMIREEGYESILYNQDVIDWVGDDGKGLTSVICASGEPDAVALMCMGYKSVVATTTGETAMPDSMVEELKKKPKVWILYDSDEAGFEGAKKLARRVGLDRSWIVRLPPAIKDANDFLVKYGERAKAEMDALIKASFRLEVPTVTHVAAVVERIREWARTREEQDENQLTPWRNLNRMIPEFSGLVVLSAQQGMGKTTFGLQIADYWANQGKPALFYCLEMRPDELVRKLIMSSYSLSGDELRSSRGAEALDAFELLYQDVPLYVGYSGMAREPKSLVELFKQAVHRYQLHLLIFDNIHLIGRGRNVREEIGAFTLALKDLSMELEIPVIAVAQPRKPKERHEIMNPWDLKDSADIVSDADQIIILHRQQLSADKDTKEAPGENEMTIYSPVTRVRLAKSRFGSTKEEFLFMEGAYHRFRELRHGEEIEYRTSRGTLKQMPWAGIGGSPAQERQAGGVLPFSGRGKEAAAPEAPDWTQEDLPPEPGWPEGKE